jgi:hypothetical protein
MTDYQERRQALRTAMRREKLDLATTGTILPTTAMLYRGSQFLQGSLAQDAEHWAKEIAAYGLRDVAQAVRLREYVRMIAPNADAPAASENVMAEAHRLLRWPMSDDLDKPAINLIRDAFARAAMYAWQLGSTDGALQVARHAFSKAQDSDKPLHRVRYLTTAAEALRSTRDGFDWTRYDHQRGKRIALSWLTSVAGDIADVVDIEREMAVLAQAAEDGKSTPLKFNLQEHLNAMAADRDDVEPQGLDADAFMLEPTVHEPQPVEPGTLVVVPSLDHLPTGRYERGAPRAEFEPLSNIALPLVPVPDIAEVASTLKAEYPWMSELTDRILENLIGMEAVSLPSPICIEGPPGSGKSGWVRRASELLKLPLTEYPCASSADNSFAGTSRQYVSGRASVPLQAVKRAMVANPLLVLDELEKASKDRKNGSLLDAVLTLLEPSSRKAFWDPYLECAVDMSALNIVATVNDSRPLKGPVLDRLILLRAPQPGPEHLEVIVAGLLRQAREVSGRDPRWIADLDGVEWDVLRKGWRGGSIRPLKRAIDRLLALRQSPGLAH